MKKRKRFLTVWTAVLTTVLLVSNIAVFAATALDTALFDLRSLGIMTGDENGAMNLDEPVTRAEFTAITVRLMNAETASEYAADIVFDDVAQDYWAKPYINYLNGIHVINGVEDGLFAPEESVTLEMAGKILVNVLGYYIPAEEKGGYPTGYLAQAQELGLLSGVDRAQTPLTRKEVAMLAYNALDIDMLVKQIPEEKYFVMKGETLRRRLSPSDGGELTKLTGIVTANIDTYLIEPVTDMSDNEIEINGKVYKTIVADAKQYLGQSVDFYVHDDQQMGKEVIISMTPTVKNTVQTFSVKDIESADINGVKYYKDDAGKKTASVRYNTETVVVRNHIPLAGWNAQTFTEAQRGTVTAIDNDADHIAEVIFLKEHTSAVVDEVRTENEMVYFKDGFSLYGKKYFEFNPENNDLYVTVVGVDGTPLTVEDIQPGDVFSVFENSASDTRIEAIVSHERATDTIHTISKDTVMIGEESYTLESDNVLNDFEVGDQITAYVNFTGEIVFAEKNIQRENYGYVIGVASVGVMDTQSKIRILVPGLLAERFTEEENEDGGAATKISKIACKNDSLRELTLSSKVNIAGSKIVGNDKISTALMDKVISYSENSAGEVNRIDFPTEVGEVIPGDGSIMVEQNKTYNSYEKTFGKTSGGAFGVDEKTMTICVPTADRGSLSNNDYLVDVEMNNGQQYTVKAFEQDKDTHMAGLIVVQAPMKAGGAGQVNTKSKVGFVTETAIALNDNGEEVQKVTMLTEGTSKSYMVSETLDQSEYFREIQQGELIAYSLNGYDELDRYASLSYNSEVGNNQAVGLLYEFTDKETFCGYALEVRYNLVSNTLNRWVHELEVAEEADGAKVRPAYEILKSGGPPVFVYYTRTQEAEFADIKEIRAGMDKIFVSAANNTVRAIVIIR